MDKLRILKEFESLALNKTLESEEIGLYLLFLANCDTQSQGEITYNTIKDALGIEFSPARLKQACRRLSKHNLIEVIPPSLDGITTNDFTVLYRIFPLTGDHRQ